MLCRDVTLLSLEGWGYLDTTVLAVRVEEEFREEGFQVESSISKT